MKVSKSTLYSIVCAVAGVILYNVWLGGAALAALLLAIVPGGGALSWAIVGVGLIELAVGAVGGLVFAWATSNMFKRWTMARASRRRALCAVAVIATAVALLAPLPASAMDLVWKTDNVVNLKDVTISQAPRLVTAGPFAGYYRLRVAVPQDAQANLEIDVYCPPDMAGVCIELERHQFIKQMRGTLAMTERGRCGQLAIVVSKRIRAKDRR